MCLPYLKFSDPLPETHFIFIWPDSFFFVKMRSSQNHSAAIRYRYIIPLSQIFNVANKILAKISEFTVNSLFSAFELRRDFQQHGILTSVDSDEPV